MQKTPSSSHQNISTNNPEGSKSIKKSEEHSSNTSKNLTDVSGSSSNISSKPENIKNVTNLANVNKDNKHVKTIQPNITGTLDSSPTNPSREIKNSKFFDRVDRTK